ncbi:RAVE subunit 2/Rogdi [Cladochytrium replicatum]|nr:RAVE subunit 2/Rogdi [Cladochytrium replicatum]
MQPTHTNQPHQQVDEDDEIWEKEELALRAELDWLFANEVPAAMEELVELLNAGLQACIPSGETGGATTLAVSTPKFVPFRYDPPTLINISNITLSSDQLKGFVTVNGGNLVRADLNVKFTHYNRGNPIKVSVAPTRPYPLPQIQTARNCFVVALDAVSSQPHPSHSRRDLKELLSKLVLLSKQAQEALATLDEKYMFPNVECDPTSFTPEIAEDLVVQFSVHRTTIVASIVGLNLHAHGGVPLHVQSKILKGFKTMKIDKYKGRPVEILDEVTVESSSSPRLATCLNALSGIEMLAASLIAQIGTLTVM